jgi:hypothetical protein
MDLPMCSREALRSRFGTIRRTNLTHSAKHLHEVLRLYGVQPPGRLLWVNQRFLQKTPRWQPRGYDTHLSGR